MSLAVSLDKGALEYSGDNLATVFAQKRNIVSPRFWSMLLDLRRFYRDAPGDVARLGAEVTLDDDGLTITGGAPLLGLDADLHDVGELTPAVAALCAGWRLSLLGAL